MRLGWYSRLVIVLWFVWTLGVGLNDGFDKYGEYLAADEKTRTACYDPSITDTDWCKDPVKLSDEPTYTILSGVVTQAVTASFYAILATLGYWAFRWVWAGRRPHPPSEGTN